MGSLTRVRFVSAALESTRTIFRLEESSIVTETGSLFKDDSWAEVDTLTFAGLGDTRGRGRLFEVDTSSALSNHVLSPRSDRKSMFLRWLNEGRPESSAGWLVWPKYEAGSNANTGRTHHESILSLSEYVEAGSCCSIVYRKPKLSMQSMLGQIGQAEPLPSLSDGSSCGDEKHIEEDIFDALIQRLYRCLYFKNVDGYRTCVNNTSGKGTTSSKTTGTSQQPGQKRPNAGSNEPPPDGDQDGRSRNVKKTKSRPNLEEFTSLFACPLCKGDIKFGYERGCRDWKSPCIDNVLRVSSASYRSSPRFMLTYGKRHLATHIEIDHISRDDFKKAQVKALKRTFTFARDGKPEDLWVAAFMVLFNYAETDRHKVPSPCTTAPLQFSAVLADC